MVDTIIEIDPTEKSSGNSKKSYHGGLTIFLMILLPLLFIGLIVSFIFIAKPLIPGWQQKESFVFNDNFVGTIDCGDRILKIVSAKYGRYSLKTTCETNVTQYAIAQCKADKKIIDKCVFSNQWIKAYNESIIDDCPGTGKETHVEYICIDWVTPVNELIVSDSNTQTVV
jgi:hypothetical protein